MYCAFEHLALKSAIEISSYLIVIISLHVLLRYFHLRCTCELGFKPGSHVRRKCKCKPRSHVERKRKEGNICRCNGNAFTRWRTRMWPQHNEFPAFPVVMGV